MPTPEFPPVTVLSLLHFVWALLWAAGIFVSIAGYGGLLLRAARLRRTGFAMAATCGFAPVVLLGGVLNLLHLIRPGVLIGFVLGGVALAGWLLPREREGVGTAGARGGSGVRVRSAMVLLALVSGVRIAATVHNPYYQPQDDLNYYLAAPEKMLAMHTFAADPYSERRITASIGGNQFLTTLVLATQPMESEAMADWTLGAFLLLALAFAIGGEFELTPLQTLVFALLLMISPQIRLNLTFVILPSALFLGLAYLAAQRRLTDESPLAQAMLIGGAVGAVASMKSNYVTHGVIFVLCLALLRWWKRGGKAAGVLVGVAALSCVVVMLPWMIASKETCGTLFYPLLGKGLHFSAYHQYPMPMHFDSGLLFRKVLLFNLPMLALFGVECFVARREERSYALASFLLAGFVASTIVGVATGGDSVRRYNFPFVIPAISLFFVLCARRGNGSAGAGWRGLQAGAALLVAGLAVNTGLSSFTWEYGRTWRTLHASVVDFRLANRPLREEYAAVQRAIPLDGGVLTSLLNPYLLDFRQRDIYLADFPGDASPKPGWPARQSGDAVAEFLLRHGVRYLAFSYGECDLQAPFQSCMAMQEFGDQRMLESPSTTALIRGEVQSGFDTRRQYQELARARRHLYDDGRIVVLDLKQRS
jgi:hypothetical protein